MSTQLCGYSKRAMKSCTHAFRITCDKSAVSLLESGEQRCIKTINNNNYTHTHSHTHTHTLSLTHTHTQTTSTQALTLSYAIITHWHTHSHAYTKRHRILMFPLCTRMFCVAEKRLYKSTECSAHCQLHDINTTPSPPSILMLQVFRAQPSTQYGNWCHYSPVPAVT